MSENSKKEANLDTRVISREEFDAEARAIEETNKLLQELAAIRIAAQNSDAPEDQILTMLFEMGDEAKAIKQLIKGVPEEEIDMEQIKQEGLESLAKRVLDKESKDD